VDAGVCPAPVPRVDRSVCPQSGCLLLAAALLC
jgi:hypothetical protein